MVEYTPAQINDIPALAALFQQAFPEALTAVFGHPRISPQVVEDALKIVYAFEPDGFFAARDTSGVAGFMVVVQDLSGLYRFLLFKGGALKLVARWCAGGYRELGFRFIPRLFKAWVDSRSKDQDLAAKKPLAQVITIVVAPGHQRQGIGRTLSERAIAYLKNTPARAVRLEVDAAKAAPIALYKKLGFVQRAVIPSPRGPAIIMTLPLKD